MPDKLKEGLDDLGRAHALGTIFKRLPELSQARDEDDVYKLLLDWGIRLIDAKGGFIILKRDRTYKLCFRRDTPRGDIESLDVKLPDEIGPLREALNSNEPELLVDRSWRERLADQSTSLSPRTLETLVDFTTDPWLKVIGVSPSQLLCAPMRTNEFFLGGIYIYDRREDNGRVFAADEKQLLRICTEVCIGTRAIAFFQEKKKMFEQFIRSLSRVVDARDRYARGHSARVANYATIIAEKMGWGQDDIELIRWAGYLHDIGKLGLRDTTTSRMGVFSEEIWGRMTVHPLQTRAILESVEELKELTLAVFHHHEDYNGGGYPIGQWKHNDREKWYFKAASILRVADSYDAMTSLRSYQSLRSPKSAHDEIIAHSGELYHPEIVEAFQKAFTEIEEATAHVMITNIFPIQDEAKSTESFPNNVLEPCLKILWPGYTLSLILLQIGNEGFLSNVQHYIAMRFCNEVYRIEDNQFGTILGLVCPSCDRYIGPGICQTVMKEIKESFEENIIISFGISIAELSECINKIVCKEEGTLSIEEAANAMYQKAKKELAVAVENKDHHRMEDRIHLHYAPIKFCKMICL